MSGEEELSRRLDQSLDARERTLGVAEHLLRHLERKEKQMETMRTRILRRIDDLIADIGRWEVALTWSSDWNGTVWLMRTGTDVVEGQLIYEISTQECTLDLWKCPTDFMKDAVVFSGNARFDDGERLSTLLQGLEKALDGLDESLEAQRSDAALTALERDEANVHRVVAPPTEEARDE